VTRVQKLTPIGALVVMLMCVVWGFVPFEFADGVRCSPPLLGAKPTGEQRPSVGLIIPEEDCLSKGKSRLLVSAMISVAAAGAATAIVFFKPISAQCNRGDHEACPDWWPNLVSASDSGFGCQCDCHSESLQFSY